MSDFLNSCLCLFLMIGLAGCHRELEETSVSSSDTSVAAAGIPSPTAEELLKPPGFLEGLRQVSNSAMQVTAELPEMAKTLFLLSQELQRLVSENDYEKARQVADGMDRFFQSRVLTWYVQILAREEKEGRPAAAELWRVFAAAPDISPMEKEALAKMDYIVHGNQEMKSMDVILAICSLALSSKYGGGAGAAFLALQHSLRPSELTREVLKKELGTDDLSSLLNKLKTQP